MTEVRLSLQEVHALATAALVRHGADEANARAVADIVTSAERDEAKSHGLFRVPGYVASLKSGKVNGAAAPKAERIAPSVVRVAGDGGFAPLAFEVGRGPLTEAARETGIAALTLTRIYHFAALWPETSMLAEEGLVAIAVTAAFPYVAPAGGTKPLFGTNPMSFAWPRADGPPMAFDQASSAMARGEIMIAGRDGHPLPDGVGLDAQGRPSRDPDAILAGAQLPFGGYKGSAIAMMVELLAGPLIGEALSVEAKAEDPGDGGPPVGGELILAIDPSRFGSAQDPRVHGERLFEQMLAQDGVRLPGDRRIAARAKTPETGVTIPESLYATIRELAAVAAD
jgi:delta1-piperideine-2-carboxylate reductase